MKVLSVEGEQNFYRSSLQMIKNDSVNILKNSVSQSKITEIVMNCGDPTSNLSISYYKFNSGTTTSLFSYRSSELIRCTPGFVFIDGFQLHQMNCSANGIWSVVSSCTSIHPFLVFRSQIFLRQDFYQWNVLFCGVNSEIGTMLENWFHHKNFNNSDLQDLQHILYVQNYWQTTRIPILSNLIQ